MKYIIEDASLVQIADKIRDKLEIPSEQKFSVLEFPDMVDSVAGYSKSLGEQQAYDEFWDSIPLTEDGDIFLTTCGFAGTMWNDTTFVPNRNITADGDAQYAFAYCRTTDLKGILEQRNITLDISKANALQSSFSRSTITRLPELNTTSAKSLEYMLFSNQNLVSVDKIILKDDGSQTITYFMRNCPSLVDVEFEGTFGATVNVSASTNLSASSIASIVSALSDTASGKTLMLSKVAVNKAFETSEGANDGSTSTEWATLVGTKTNWTISLV